MSRRALSLLLVLTLGASCQRTRPNGELSTQTAADTLVGVVTEVGADPATWMSVRPSDQTRSLRLSGAGVGALRNVGGAEVWLSGARTGDDFRVDEFEVRRVNGQPVDDGIVVSDQTGIMVRMRSGVQRSVPHAPSALRDMGGARIWISRPVAGTTPSYGLIAR